MTAHAYLGVGLSLPPFDALVRAPGSPSQLLQTLFASAAHPLEHFRFDFNPGTTLRHLTCFRCQLHNSHLISSPHLFPSVLPLSLGFSSCK